MSQFNLRVKRRLIPVGDVITYRIISLHISIMCNLICVSVCVCSIYSTNQVEKKKKMLLLLMLIESSV